MVITDTGFEETEFREVLPLKMVDFKTRQITMRWRSHGVGVGVVRKLAERSACLKRGLAGGAGFRLGLFEQYFTDRKGTVPKSEKHTSIPCFRPDTTSSSFRLIYTA